MNLNVNKKFDFEAYVYYIKNNDSLLRKSSANLFVNVINSDDPLLRKSFAVINEIFR